MNSNGGCSQFCINFQGSYNCSCSLGFDLYNKTCIGKLSTNETTPQNMIFQSQTQMNVPEVSVGVHKYVIIPMAVLFVLAILDSPCLLMANIAQVCG